MNTKLKANNFSELKQLVKWFKNRFPETNRNDLKKFLNAVK